MPDESKATLKSGRGAQLDTRTIFLPRLPQGGEGRGEEANVYKHEPLAPALSPFGGERELFSFGAGIRMHPRQELV
jgi:hypothetical protein